MTTRSAGAKLLWLTALTAAGLVASATAATVYSAGKIQRKHARLDSASVVSLDAARGTASLVALTDSLVAPLGPLSPIDSITLAQIVALLTAPADSATWIPHAAADTAHAATTAAYRRWTRSAPLTAFWGIRPGFPGIEDSRAVPMLRLQPLKRLWKESEAAADSALSAGDTDTALLRARETLAGARHLINQPSPIDALVGRVMLSDGAKLLARAALQADQPALHSSAQRLLSMTRAWTPVPRGLWTMSPRTAASTNLLDMAGDRTLSPATRFVAIEVMVAGACVNTREVLFGPSAARHEAVNAMIDAAGDIPRLSELRPFFHRTLAKLDQSPETFAGDTRRPPPSDEPMLQTLLRLVVPARVQARVDACDWSGA
ncbi:MAG: hypothetical protein IPP90_19005 [Gemmatimonadaceae bacterium]|nr:hypothetical protein [Gemmatimonadaceae bacterium]